MAQSTFDTHRSHVVWISVLQLRLAHWEFCDFFQMLLMLVCVWELLIVGELLIGLQYLMIPPLLVDFFTTFLKNCGM